MILDGYRDQGDSLKTDYRDIERDIEDNQKNNIENENETHDGNSQTRICYKNYYLFLQIFFLTFMAEVGDRSQIATIVLGGSQVILDFSFRIFMVLF